ncbi:MAG: diacylglycerol kinase family lipid kinase [bacterium]|nr:diacylglycerol kinase family lipid kinase [bacterium]
MKLLFVYNPHSGTGKIKNKLSDVVETMVRAGYDVTVYPTQAAGDATRIVRERAAKYDLVVCCGGDGTLDETVTGLMDVDRRVPLGYIPAGSTNDFANSLKLPKDMIKAAQIAVSGKDFACDVGCFNEDRFVYVAAFGLFTEVSYQTRQELKNILGHAAYVLEGAKSLNKHPAYRMRVSYGNQNIEGDFIYGMITNSVSVGGFKGMTGKNVKLDDGVFEVTLIKAPGNRNEFNEIIACLTNLRAESDLIYSFKTDELSILPYCTIPWTLDGEFGGNQTQVFIKNDKQALTIRVKDA